MLKIFPESLIFLPKIKYNCLRYAYMDMDDYIGNIHYKYSFYIGI